MKEKKVRIYGVCRLSRPEEWCVELPLSELYAQLKEQGIDPECPFCECGQEWVNHDPNKCKKPIPNVGLRTPDITPPKPWAV